MSVVTQITASGETRDIADSRIGDLSSLQTSEKESIVGAINEIAESSGGGAKVFPFSFPTASSNGVKLTFSSAKVSKEFIDLKASADFTFTPTVDSAFSVISQISSSDEVAAFMKEVWGDELDSVGGRSSFSGAINYSSRIGEPGVETFCTIYISVSFTMLANGKASAACTYIVSPMVVMSPGTFAYAGETIGKRIPILY